MHLESDLLLIYQIHGDDNIVYFVRTGSHSQLLNR
jgi:addiction module RelE/StbE family toxin